jgi:hypothetical protein
MLRMIMNEIAVVHLVRAQNGIKPLQRFLRSYHEGLAGMDHDLVIVMKGFEQGIDISDYLELLSSFRHSIFNVPDVGLDITAYHAVAKYYTGQYRYFCFLNSYSKIQGEDWLEKMYHYLVKSNVGLVGVSGSWHRIGCGQLYLKKTYYDFLHNFKKNYQKKHCKRLWLSITVAIKDLKDRLLNIVNFSKFPNYHIRTNAFMISSNLLQQFTFPPVFTKMDAYRFESGRNGLTMQVLKKGLKILVVGKDGIGYEMNTWDQSGTFWQAEQENLLISDNQTDDYQYGTPDRRRFLSFAAWGE